jgi:SPP1 gp7 family putative phage head morphogenesis protein
MNPKFLKWVKENGLDRVTDINNTTKEKLRITLADGIEAGEGIPHLRDRISSAYSDAKGYRSTLIARTETITTVNAGSLDTYKSAKVKQKEWLSQIDNRTRIAHVEINGEIKNIDEAFSNGEMYPNEPNCRCTILPVLE